MEDDLKRFVTSGQAAQKAVDELTKPGCPFYGKHAHEGGLMQQRSNQCALMLTAPAPCIMEPATPNWRLCPRAIDATDLVGRARRNLRAGHPGTNEQDLRHALRLIQIQRALIGDTK